MTRAEAIRKFDFEGEMELSEESAEKMERGLLSIAELVAAVDAVERSMLEVCGGLTSDLGRPLPADGASACDAATKAVQEELDRLPVDAHVAVKLTQAACSVDRDAIAACAKTCDDGPPLGPLGCEPGKLQGACPAACTGTCTPKEAGPCVGVCDGTCKGEVDGTCSGACRGTCDGRASTGPCEGRCVGACEGAGLARCAGVCAGACRSSVPMRCDGTCTGECTPAMSKAICAGDALPPLMGAECEARCYLRGVLGARCSPGRIDVTVTGAAAEEAAALRAAFERAGPRITTVQRRVEKLGLAGGTTAAALNELKDVMAEVARKGGDPATRVRVASKIGACLTPAVKSATTTLGRIRASASSLANVVGAVQSVSLSAARASGRVGASATHLPSTLASALPAPSALPEPPALPLPSALPGPPALPRPPSAVPSAPPEVPRAP